MVHQNIHNRGFSGNDAVKGLSISDLDPGVYEGGLKIWEGSIDLCNYLDTSYPAEDNECPFANLRVLELGCGAALPSILCLKKGAKGATANDFNEFVLSCFTADNFRLNGISEERWACVSGEWSELLDKGLESNSYDLILTSETIYNEKSYPALHQAMDTFLKHDGRVLLSAKNYYFGLDASLPTFVDFVNSRKVFNVKFVWSSSSSVSRSIVELRRIVSKDEHDV